MLEVWAEAPDHVHFPLVEPLLMREFVILFLYAIVVCSTISVLGFLVLYYMGLLKTYGLSPYAKDYKCDHDD